MMLTPNPHFDHLPVNASLSTVLIPPNVEEYGKVSFQITKNPYKYCFLRSGSHKRDPMV
jgi:hypothetical protein